MFLKNFIKSGLISAIGNMPDYWIILNAAGWLDKGVLEQSDLIEIQQKIEASKVVEEVPEEIVEPEEIPEEVPVEDGDV